MQKLGFINVAIFHVGSPFTKGASASLLTETTTGSDDKGLYTLNDLKSREVRVKDDAELLAKINEVWPLKEWYDKYYDQQHQRSFKDIQSNTVANALLARGCVIIVDTVRRALDHSSKSIAHKMCAASLDNNPMTNKIIGACMKSTEGKKLIEKGVMVFGLGKLDRRRQLMDIHIKLIQCGINKSSGKLDITFATEIEYHDTKLVVAGFDCTN